LLLLFGRRSADVLPDNRAECGLQHTSGGGMDITGFPPTARAEVTEKLLRSESQLFLDKVSGASIDVLRPSHPRHQG